MSASESSKPGEIVLRVLALCGLVTSSILLFDYVNPLYALCGSGGGCEAVRLSRFSYVGPIPVPAIGISYFASVMLLALLPGARARRLLPWLAGAGATVSITLLWIQHAEIHRWCEFCVATDVAALLLFLTALATARRPAQPGSTGRALWGATAVFAIIMPLVIGYARMPKYYSGLPPAVRAEQQRGVATIVEFVDFECPFCRKQIEVFDKILPDYGAKVRVVRKMNPLPMHEHAVVAAMSYCCVDDIGHGDDMAAALFKADDLTADGCQSLAARFGLDAAGFKTCMDSQKTRDRVTTEMSEAKDSKVEGLPTFWIGGREFIGLTEDEAVLRKSIDQAIADAR